MAQLDFCQLVHGDQIATDSFKLIDPTAPEQAVALSNSYDSWSDSSAVGVVAELSNYVYISPTLTTTKALPSNSMLSGVTINVNGIYLPAPYGTNYCRVFFLLADNPSILDGRYVSADLTANVRGIYSEGSGYISGTLSLEGFATNVYKYCAFGVGVALQLDDINVYRNKAKIGSNSVIVTYEA